VKQAEALAREIQKNEEAQRWAEQVKGNVGALRGLGMPSFFNHLTISLPFTIQHSLHYHHRLLILNDLSRDFL